MRRRHALIGLIGLLSWGLIACTAPAEGTAEATVRGVLLQVEGPTLTRVDRIRLRDANGREWVFTIAPEAEGDRPGERLDPGHLRLHLAYGQPVTVHYRKTPTGLIAERITD
jgi:hypothetical protein